MAAPQETTHHIRVRSTQLEMPAPHGSRSPEDFDRKLRDAQEELERIQQEKEELARKKHEAEELASRKHRFITRHVELVEKLTSSLTMIDRGLSEIRSEAEDLQQCREVFASHLSKLGKIIPENWPMDALTDRLDKANASLDIAEDDFDQAATHFNGTRSGSIFGRATGRGSRAKTHGGEFFSNLRNGFAFNFPIVALGSLALIVYLLK
ncbi:MAG: hypothetical protein V4733_05660 [Verrucomicrobiota bacterium]